MRWRPGHPHAEQALHNPGPAYRQTGVESRLHKKEPALPGGRVLLRSLFPCYFAGLLVFTIFLYPVSDLYYLLFYGRPGCRGL